MDLLTSFPAETRLLSGFSGSNLRAMAPGSILSSIPIRLMIKFRSVLFPLPLSGKNEHNGMVCVHQTFTILINGNNVSILEFLHQLPIFFVHDIRVVRLGINSCPFPVIPMFCVSSGVSLDVSFMLFSAPFYFIKLPCYLLFSLKNAIRNIEMLLVLTHKKTICLLLTFWLNRK